MTISEYYLNPVKEDKRETVGSIDLDEFLGVAKSGLEEDLIQVCHRCAMVLDMFTHRHETIIFLSQVPTGMLRALKVKPAKNWDKVAITKLVRMYRDGPNRCTKIIDDLNVMEKHATIRQFKQRNFSVNLGKKT